MLSNNEKSLIKNLKYWMKQEKLLIDRIAVVRRSMSDILSLADAAGKCEFSECVYSILAGEEDRENG